MGKTREKRSRTSRDAIHRVSTAKDTLSPVLQARHVSVQLTTEQGTFEALHDVCLTVGQQQTVGLVGESGCGKSLVALTLAGLIEFIGGRVTQGEILHRGRDLLGLSAHKWREVRGRAMSLIFQEPRASLNPVLPIGLQVNEVLRARRGLSHAAARQTAVELLGSVGIPQARQRMSQYPHQLSGGLCQRVMIAIALACRPDILIADEPTTALDVTIQAQILKLLREQQQKHKMGLLLITHDMGVVAHMCDVAAVMYAGWVVEQAPVRDLFARPKHPYTAGLLACVPLHGFASRGSDDSESSESPRGVASKEAQPLVALAGHVPGLHQRIKGCPFAPRCAHATLPCSQRMPPWEEDGRGRGVRCFHPL
ncbi:MAG: ABC transporter ATP-binding protein [Myxococcota bacterium]